jgi:hypothetical protein
MLHRRKTSAAEAIAGLLENIAMLDSPTAPPGRDVKPKSSNVTPVESPVTVKAYPVVVGETWAALLALYVQFDALEQSRPPYTASPSREPSTTSFSL